MQRLTAFACAIALSACTRAVREPRLHRPVDVPPATARHDHLKVHLMSGELVVADTWAKRGDTLSGTGVRYGLDRREGRPGTFALPFDSIALLESEVRVGTRVNATAGMAVWTVLWGTLTAVCVSDPKACFGSCPTFYVATDTGEALAAEGFSASIARVLEVKDLDALAAGHAGGGPFTLRMRNEALETHAVRRLTLLAAQRPPGGRVLATADGRFFPTTAVTPPTGCRAAEGDCLDALGAQDRIERVSAADSTDLAAKETVELVFPGATGRLGVVIAARQSLMSTYLFYQTMGYLGTRAGATLAALERGGRAAAERAMGMARLIAPIDVDILEGDRWTRIGVHDEAGPLATQLDVLPFTRRSAGPVRVRLTAAQGAWRLDWIALAHLGEPVAAVPLAPETVWRDGRPDSAALALLRNPNEHLVTYPGDTYEIEFSMPRTNGEWELFLESEGYYYEWMRSEWLADENPALAFQALADPAAALRTLAPAFKRAVPKMERLFWTSRFGR